MYEGVIEMYKNIERKILLKKKLVKISENFKGRL